MLGAAFGAAFNGFTLNQEMKVGALRSGTSTTFTLDVDENVRYVLVATCDADCDDVDLVLSETDGRVVTADRRANDVAVLSVPSGHPGAHRVTVSMASCRNNPCRYGLGLFTK